MLQDVPMIDDFFPDTLQAQHVTYHATDDNCPRTIVHALTGPDADKWRAALDREMGQHKKNSTFGPALDPKDLPPGTKPVPVDAVLKIKRDGTYKVRVIIKGFKMTEGVDYNETFSPVPCANTVRFFMAHSAKHDWEIMHGDVNTAFLASDMDTYVVVAVPNYLKSGATGRETGYTLHVLQKGVPGIPQGPKLWNKKSHKIYHAQQLIRSHSDYCLYFCHKRNLFLVVWVDDLFLFFPTTAMNAAKELWAALQSDLDLGEWEDVSDCLGCVVQRDRPNRVLTMTQEPSAHKLLQINGLVDANPKETPMVANCKLTKKDCPSAEQAAVMIDEQRWYRSTVASLIHFSTWTRPDLAYAVSKECRFMHNPGRVHIVALKRTLRFLCATADYGLRYDFGPASRSAKCGLYGFYDAAHADCPDTMRSTLAHVFFYFNCAISWHTKLHSVVTTSTNHSEFCAAAKAAREAKWWDKFMTEIGLSRFVRPIDLFSDSKGAIAMTYNPVNRSASKHIDLADHYAREQQELGVITVSYVNTRDMIADLLTKPLGHADFARHAAKLVASAPL